MEFAVVLLVIVVVMGAGLRAVASRGGRRSGPGAGAAGAVYDMLNEDRRKAIEIVVEERAGYRDPEHADDTPTPGQARRRPK